MNRSGSATINIYPNLWHVQVAQLLMAERQKDAKIMGPAAPIAATN